MKYEVLVDGVRCGVEITRRAEAPSRIVVTRDGRQFDADAVESAPGAYSILIDGQSFELHVEEAAGNLLVRSAGRRFAVEIVDPRSWQRRHGGGIQLEGRQQVAAPMPGKVVRILVSQGQQVEAGQGLLVVEAMKMQNELHAPKSGTIEQLLIQEGQAVNAGQILAVVV
jgi:biotin carboxyl carrier protein